MSLPGALIPWIEMRFLLPDGSPNAGGKIATYTAGTSTPKSVYTTSDVSTVAAVAHANPVVLDAYGRPPSPIFLAAGGTKFLVYDADDVLQYTVDNVEDIALTWLSELGIEFGTGASDVTSGYTVLTTDLLITVASTGGADPCLVNLPAAAGRGEPIGIKNVGGLKVAVTPNGSDTIDSVAGAFTLPPATGGLSPAVWLVSDGVSNWSILASHALQAPRQIQLAAAPTSGTWAKGDLVWNSNPSAGGAMGWMCVTAGTPGTWKAMPNLAS
jgi:hypothetical protein